MKGHLLGTACVCVLVFSASGNAALLSSYSFGSPDSSSGHYTTLKEMLPGRFQLVYGNLFICEDPPDCDFWNPNPAPPVTTIFDIQITGSIAETFILNCGSDFHEAVALATDGNLDPLNFDTEFSDGSGFGTSLGSKESAFYGTPIDLQGFNISQFELILNLTFDSPGEDPNGDGIWVDAHRDWTFNVYGSPVPVPSAVYLFITGFLGLVGIARRKQST